MPAGAQGVTPKAAGNGEVSPVVTVPSQNTLSNHDFPQLPSLLKSSVGAGSTRSAGAPAPAAAAALSPPPDTGSCGGASAADDSKGTSSSGTSSAMPPRTSKPPLATSVVGGATSSTGHAPVDSAQLIRAIADLVMRSRQLESRFLTLQQQMGQIMLAHQALSTQVADSLARLSALYEAAVGASIRSYDEEYGTGGAGVDDGGDTSVPDGFDGDASKHRRLWRSCGACSPFSSTLFWSVRGLSPGSRSSRS